MSHIIINLSLILWFPGLKQILLFSVNIGGRTLCSALSIDVGKKIRPLQSTDLMRLQKELRFETLSLIIVDEVSNIDAKIMAGIDIRLRELAGDDKSNLPFGGIGIIFFGDMGQLPPVKSKSLPFSVMQMTTVKGTNDGAISAQPTLMRPSAEQNASTEQQPRRKKV